MGIEGDRPGGRRRARRDEPVTITEGDLMDMLLVLDDLAAVVQMAANTPDSQGGRNTAYAANIAQKLREMRAKVRDPDDDIAGMERGANVWSMALCAALNNVPLEQALWHRMFRLNDVVETGDRHREGTALYNLGLALAAVRRFDEAITANQQAAAIFVETGDRYSEGQARYNLGLALAETGDLHLARTHWTQARDAFLGAGATDDAETVRNHLDALPADDSQ
jgi:tetratricopeptide (TPR) repeat protein